MPLIDDYNLDDDEDGQPGGDMGGAPSAGGGTAAPGQPQPAARRQAKGAAFVPWQRMVAANQEVSQREANKLQSGVRGAAVGAQQQLQAGQSAFGKKLDSNFNARPSAFGAPPSAMGGPPKPQRQAGADAMAAPLSPLGDETKTGGGVGLQKVKTFKDDLLGGYGFTDGKLTKGADAPELQGPKNLEESMGEEAWTSLLGQTERAQQGANALGSEKGVQALLQKQAAGVTNSGLDAALLGGAGGRDFRAINREFGNDKLKEAAIGAFGDSQKQWDSLVGKLDDAQQRKAWGDRTAFEEERYATEMARRQAAELAASQGAYTNASASTKAVAANEGYDKILKDIEAKGWAANKGGKAFEKGYTENPFLHPHNWLKNIDSGEHVMDPQRDQKHLAKQIGADYGLSDVETMDAFNAFYESLPPKMQEWVVNLTGNAHSETGGAVLSAFAGDEASSGVAGVTGAMNSTPEEWRMFQELFRAYLEKQKYSNYGTAGGPSTADVTEGGV